ncbi:ubiquitin carboxyl-terminal hydrolase [Colletotrichum truncatum]|uniref:Ubiquitin carboxyl-terminal hydrolase n=1 Tax=Colletotrichum truncatum TaxID=5467 RepID=A0ACC3Z5Y1_COLTU|nr:ubiquitin carboxyl-terminal hydrolase [Colletotrichum truncatum]KAF6787244.1 ubiquitin carboxyl-terminal hydrolase [Colletotrichum truncatum]
MMLSTSCRNKSQRQLRSRKVAGSVIATQYTTQPTSDETVNTEAESDRHALEISPEVDVSSAIANSHAVTARGARSRKNKESPTETVGEAAMNNTRRNPKRKATEADATMTSITASKEAKQPNVLLREALEPISKDELRDWEGWCEVESEPAFFNAMLGEMGVRDVKVQEVFSVDEDYVATLPQPVYGFIFLYQYFAEDYEDNEAVEGRDLWFANQTTDNACATVALTNILMNSTEVELGPKLQEFKAATNDLSTPLRGHALGSNHFIRSVHNAFTRRMDHLNADLALENEAAESKKKKRRGPSKARRSKKQKVDSESGYHFIAYVPANGSVWELDGLKTRPVCLGPLKDGTHWTNLVRPDIQARMLQFEESALSFNLLALCNSPLTIIAKSLARTIRSFELLNDRTKGIEEWKALVAGNEQPLKSDEQERLAAFRIGNADLKEAEIDPTFEKKVTNSSMDMMELFELHISLVTEQKSLMSDYNAEVAFMNEDEDRVQGRKKDHTPAVHCWVQKLADHGVLADWAANS